MPELEQPVTPEAAEVEQAGIAPVPEAGLEAEQDQEQKKVGGVQKKIDKLTRERYELREQLAEMRGRLAAIEQAKAAQPQAQTAKQDADDPRPKQDDFANYEEFVESLSRWVARQEHKTMSAKQQEEARKQEASDREREIFDSFRARRAAFETEHDDFVEVVNKVSLVPEVANSVQVALMEDENGPALAYYLGENPEVCQRLNELSATQAVKYLGRLSERLFPEHVESDEPRS